jgi:hypothetical protein
VVEYLAVPLQALVAVGFLVAGFLVVECLVVECLVVALLWALAVGSLVAECQNQECLAVLSLVLVKMLVELDLAVHKMSRAQLDLSLTTHTRVRFQGMRLFPPLHSSKEC